tara:strand:- start:4305 stop:4466 length:162 start_codon:yes stop_codon:yes gene_type:complete
MKKLLLLLLLSTGCSMLFNADKYNPDPTPKPVIEVIEEPVVKPDTVKTIIIID